MYFSDEIFLVKETRKKNTLMQFETERTETAVWAEITSIGSSEFSEAGTNGFKAEARAIIHVDDYNGQTLIRIPEGIKILSAGYYEAYRTYLLGDVIELYLREKEGVR